MHGEDGRPVRSVTTRDVEWDEEQQSWMRALADYEANLCPNCGRHLSICTDPESEGKWHAPAPTRCFPTTVILEARKPYDEKAHHSRALLFTAVPKP